MLQQPFVIAEPKRQPITPPQRLKLQVVKIAVVPDRCKGCHYCIEVCSKKVLAQSNTLNVRGVYPPIVVDEDNCVGCGVCEEICPDMAIFLLRGVKDET